ncbi:MAG: transposase [Candidatus Tectimicrobiota bacterium]
MASSQRVGKFYAQWRGAVLPWGKRSDGGRPRQVDLRAVLQTIRSLHRSGCPWAMLPHHLLPQRTVYDYFSPWRDDGTWTTIVTA